MNTHFSPKLQVVQSHKDHVPLGKDDSRKSQNANSIKRVFTADLESKNENRYENSVPWRGVHFGNPENANSSKYIKQDTRNLAYFLRKAFLSTAKKDHSVYEATGKEVSEWKERADQVSQDELKQWAINDVISFGEVLAHCRSKEISVLANKFAVALEHVLTGKNQNSECLWLEDVPRLLYIHGQMALDKFQRTNNCQDLKTESFNKILFTIEGALHKILNEEKNYYIRSLSDISNTFFHLDRMRSRDLHNQKNLIDGWISAMAGEIKCRSVEQLQSTPYKTEMFITRSLGVLQKEENKNLENVGEAIAKLQQLAQMCGQTSMFRTNGVQRPSYSEGWVSAGGKGSFPEQTKISDQTPTDRVKISRNELMHRDVSDSRQDSPLDSTPEPRRNEYIKQDTRNLAYFLRTAFLPTAKKDDSVYEVKKSISEWKERAYQISQDELKQWSIHDVIFFGEVMAHCPFKENSVLVNKFAAALEHVITAKNQKLESFWLEDVFRLLYIYGRTALDKLQRPNNWQDLKKESLNKILLTIEGALHKILNEEKSYHIRSFSDIPNTLFHLDRMRSVDLHNQKNLIDGWISAMAGEIKCRSVEELRGLPHENERFITRSLGVLQKEENKNLENVGEAIAKLKQLGQIYGQASVFRTNGVQRPSYSEGWVSAGGEGSFPEQTKISDRTPTDFIEEFLRKWMQIGVPDSWEVTRDPDPAPEPRRNESSGLVVDLFDSCLEDVKSGEEFSDAQAAYSTFENTPEPPQSYFSAVEKYNLPKGRFFPR
ncbi:MAG: hypothetical protein C5B47_03050, partial [Verrucomicrobia bacterium]